MTKRASLPCSVIIPVYNAAGTIVSCLHSVCGQKTTYEYEVIVADSSDDDTPNLVLTQFPQVKLVRFHQRTDAGSARNEAIRQARGEVLIFTDADCIVPPDWVERMITAHKTHGYQAIGGSVVNGNPESPISVALYLKEFSEYLPEMKASVVHSVPTCNMSYRRTVFEELGGFDGRYFPQEDYLFHWLLAKAGIKIYFEPEIQVRHIHRQHLGAYLRHCYRFGIVTARVLKITDYPGCFFVQRPYIAPLFIPALPFIKFARTCWRVLRASPQLLFRHALVLPLLMIGLFMWQAGFAVATYSPNPSLTATRVAIF